MRKRLYQTPPKDSNLIEDIQSAYKEKSSRRFYAEKSGGDACSKAAPLKQLESFYTVHSYFEKQYGSLPESILSGWNHSISTSMKFFEWYLLTNRAMIKTGCTLSYDPFCLFK